MDFTWEVIAGIFLLIGIYIGIGLTKLVSRYTDKKKPKKPEKKQIVFLRKS
jgi:hypothetical protein